MTAQFDGESPAESQIESQEEATSTLLKAAIAGEINLLTLTSRERLAIVAKVARYFKAHAEKHDRAGTFPFENYQLLRAIRFPALTIPKALGGGGISLEEMLRLQAEIAKMMAQQDWRSAGIWGLVNILGRVISGRSRSTGSLPKR